MLLMKIKFGFDEWTEPQRRELSALPKEVIRFGPAFEAEKAVIRGESVGT
jgi:hypothetical protein